MSENCRLAGCYDTVIAAMARRIEQLENELNYKQRQVDILSESLLKSESPDRDKRPSDMLFKPTFIDPDDDPFEGGGR